MRDPLAPLRGFRRPVYVVGLGQLVNLFGSGLVYPFATVHFHLSVGIALSLIGVGLLANNVATAVGTTVGGYVADRYGRKPVMVASMALSSVTLAAYAAVEAIAAATLLSPAGAFIAVATAAGFTLGLYAPASQAMIADLTEGDRRDRGYALLKVANNAGFGLGFVVGGVLYAYADLAVFVGNGATSAVVAGVLLALVPRAHQGARDVAVRDSIGDWGRAVTDRRILALAGLNVGFAVMYAQMQATVPVVATETLGLTSGQLGTLYTLNPIVIVLLQLPLVAAVTDWRRTRALVVSTALWGSSMLAVWAVAGASAGVGVALVGAFLVLRTLGEILHAPLITSLASDLGAAEERGAQLSLLEVAKRLGFGVGAAVGGAFFDYGLEWALWPLLAAVCVALGVGVLWFERHVTPAENGRIPAVGGDGSSD
ncbi:MFS transporter [Halorubrum sp. JWXQ-INN 858]|uniref:MFS transporter n=1 Tax=Halorubrum sp. JWXQ-INN 858 TaxID=2690782 RepID=UPI0013FCA7D9|nr:MFS transporter [Halorubrum sp. JWXQ-INN 858]MWV64512.1 MFS transporter [Halorubrum sp. JWXQ-INN 858]